MEKGQRRDLGWGQPPRKKAKRDAERTKRTKRKAKQRDHLPP